MQASREPIYCHPMLLQERKRHSKTIKAQLKGSSNFFIQEINNNYEDDVIPRERRRKSSKTTAVVVPPERDPS